MNPLIMTAFLEGVAVVVTSIFNTAAKKGFAIAILILWIGSLSWAVIKTEQRREADKEEFRKELHQAAEMLEKCNAERAALAVKVAQLEIKIQFISKSK